MDALDNRTLKPLCSLTVRDSILRLKHSGIPEWQGFEALYLWFIQKPSQVGQSDAQAAYYPV